MNLASSKRACALAAVDITLHEYLLNSPQRERDPEKASIFFVPVYLARLFNWFWTRQHCTPESTDPLTCMREPDVRPLSPALAALTATVPCLSAGARLQLLA